ncbi:MAG: HpaII family restriction endonuclease [Alphaproteobacteria bacterium]|nr:HpaII family restriction endonuclease [Alphaproteobacteria bacterium]
MVISRNAGEWAELYTLLKSLSDGKLFSADGDLNLIAGRYYPIIQIDMQQKNTKEPISYIVDTETKSISVELRGEKPEQISMNRFKEEAESFFKIISSRGKAAFEVPEISSFLEKLKTPETKQSSDKKADIHMVIHDVMTGIESNVGFSIKSKHSKPSTLINASGQTLFQYEVKHASKPVNKEEIKELLAVNPDPKEGPKARIRKLEENGYHLAFKKVKSEKFRENLQIIDSQLDHILGSCLHYIMLSSKSMLTDVLPLLAAKNPCQYNASSDARLLSFYEYKMKRLITDAALGMTPSKPWDGEYDASGGYLVVKDTGDIACYHLYNWNTLQDYLYKHLRFETPPSTGKNSKASFNYALYYEVENIPYVDICLQIRFK